MSATTKDALQPALAIDPMVVDAAARAFDDLAAKWFAGEPSADKRAALLEAAAAIEAAGAFSLVLECIPSELAREVGERISIPTIGIGAGPHCDGQVLVMHDMLGLSDWAPSFVKQYANLGALASQAARNFAEEVANSKFPDARHSYR